MITLEGVTKSYSKTSGHGIVEALHGVELDIARGEVVAILGSTGSGTSTLMNILGCLDMPTTGHYLIEGLDVTRLSRRRLRKMRSSWIGALFPSCGLLPEISVLENVELPLFRTLTTQVRHERAQQMLSHVGFAVGDHTMPDQLSPVQQRKALIARALITNPPLLLADDPAHDLGSTDCLEVMALFTELHNRGRTVVFSTHEQDIAACATRTVRLHEGRIVSTPPANPPSHRRKHFSHREAPHLKVL